MTQFAEGTEVPIHKSRSEIDRLLQDWGASGVQWADDWDLGRVFLRFMWMEKKTGHRFHARLVVQLETNEQLDKKARGKRYWLPAPAGKLAKMTAARGRREHRVLLLWLKAAFNAIELKIISAEELFLPFMEGADGRTVAEMALPGIERLLSPGGGRLMLPPAGGSDA